MSSSQNTSFGPGITGPHPTLAGNMLDPNIQSDGNMTGGPGVGGTSAQHVREEGAEHIRQNPETTSRSAQEGLASSGLGSSGLDSTSRLGGSEDVATRAPTDDNVHTGSDPLESAAPPETDTADSDVSKQSHEAKLHDKHASTRENVDAIPTAGGEKLGAKHWGESKIVPENPKPEAGISDSNASATVRDNTNKNTGSAHHEPTGTGAHHEGMMEKVKEKLHLGSSLGAANAD